MTDNATSSSQSLDTEILLELDKFNRGSLKKRLTNELVKFSNLGAYIHAEYINDSNNYITITIIPKDEDNIYHFDITNDYPFRPPLRFRINYKSYTQYLKIESLKTLNELKLYNGLNCLCCHTISCGGKWGPTMRLINYINEYKQIKQYRRDIINRILIQKIIYKYLYPGVNLLEWLIYY
jgi:hypothetical protein